MVQIRLSVLIRGDQVQVNGGGGGHSCRRVLRSTDPPSLPCEEPLCLVKWRLNENDMKAVSFVSTFLQVKSTCLCLHGGYRDGHTLPCLSVCHSDSRHGSLFWHFTGGVTWCLKSPSTFHDTHRVGLKPPVMQRLGVDRTADRMGGKKQHFYKPFYPLYSNYFLYLRICQNMFIVKK